MPTNGRDLLVFSVSDKEGNFHEKETGKFYLEVHKEEEIACICIVVQYADRVRKCSDQQSRIGSTKYRGSHELSNPVTDSEGITTWDCVCFGNYWQNDTNGDGIADKNDEKEPIKWRVLSVDGDDAFLLADKNLDVQRYNDSDTDVTWEICTMRSWLNGYGAEANVRGNDYTIDNFLDNAFTDLEQARFRKRLW